MKLYNAELDCLKNLIRKLKDNVEVLEGEYYSTKSEGYKNRLAPEIIKTREALVAIEDAKDALKGIEL